MRKVGAGGAAGTCHLWVAVPSPFLVTLLFIFVILTPKVGGGMVVGAVQCNQGGESAVGC